MIGGKGVITMKMITEKNGYYVGYDGRLESGHSYGYSWEVDSSGNKRPNTEEHYSGLQVSDDYWTK